METTNRLVVLGILAHLLGHARVSEHSALGSIVLLYIYMFVNVGFWTDPRSRWTRCILNAYPFLCVGH